MTDEDYARKIDELDRLLNDPDVSMQPERIWSLLDDVSRQDDVVDVMPQTCKNSSRAAGFATSSQVPTAVSGPARCDP
jgi:hypothetical protein